MVQLRDLLEDPEGLPVHLLLQVGGKQVLNLVLLADCDHSEQVAEGAAVVLDPLLRVFDEVLYFLVDFLPDLGVEADEEPEKAQEVDQSPDCEDGHVPELLD